jgi:O-methyltransferase involved in polyketide biosynthesis
VYDYFLGGTANWPVDREFGRRVLERFPLVKEMAVENRHFLKRVVRHLTKLGVRQFLDIGAGVPTAGNTHQVAERIAKDARVVYVDNEPVAVAHGKMLLHEHGDPARQAVIQADLRDPEHLWQESMATGILDPTEPIALLLVAVLHFEQPGPDGKDIGAQVVAEYRDKLPAGSYLAISHVTDDGVPDNMVPRMADLKRMYDSSSASNLMYRFRPEIADLFGDFEMLDPTMVWTPQWHPEETGSDTAPVEHQNPSQAALWAGVGRKTG